MDFVLYSASIPSLIKFGIVRRLSIYQQKRIRDAIDTFFGGKGAD
jgi:hypothetical protein